MEHYDRYLSHSIFFILNFFVYLNYSNKIPIIITLKCFEHNIAVSCLWCSHTQIKSNSFVFSHMLVMICTTGWRSCVWFNNSGSNHSNLKKVFFLKFMSNVYFLIGHKNQLKGVSTYILDLLFACFNNVIYCLNAVPTEKSS